MINQPGKKSVLNEMVVLLMEALNIEMKNGRKWDPG